MTEDKPAKHLLSPWVIVLTFFLLYFFTASPSIGWRDGPEFPTATQTLGIAHPAGYPTYSLITKIFTYLPLGTIPFRITIAVSIFGSLGLLFLFLAIHRLVNYDYDACQSNVNISSWAAAIVTIVFGLSPSLWVTATEIEVYSLNFLFLSIIAYCLIQWANGQGTAYLYWAGFAYGLSSGNHGSVGLYLPGLIIFYFWVCRRDPWRQFFLLIFFFLIGFSVYLYLPIRSSANPVYDWGNPQTWEQFLVHVTDRKDQGHHFRALSESKNILHYIFVFVTQTPPRYFWLLGLPCLIIGIWRLFRTQLPILFLFFYISVIHILFFIKWKNPSIFLPAFLLMAIAIGIGASYILNLFLERYSSEPQFRRFKSIFILTCSLVFLSSAFLQFPSRNRSFNYLSFEFFLRDYLSLSSEAIDLTQILWFHHYAYQSVFRIREDVTILSTADFILPSVFTPISADRYPNIDIPPCEYTVDGSHECLQNFLTANLDKKRDIYFESSIENDLYYINLEPSLFNFFKFTREPEPILSLDKAKFSLNIIRLYLKDSFEDDAFYNVEQIDSYLIDKFLYTAEYYRLKKQNNAAINLLRFLEDFLGPKGLNRISNSALCSIKTQLGVCFMEMGQLDQALSHLQEATDYCGEYQSWIGLATFYLNTGKKKEAKNALEHAIILSGQRPDAHFLFGEYYFREKDFVKAKEYYKVAESRIGKRVVIVDIKKQIRNRLAQIDEQTKEMSQ